MDERGQATVEIALCLPILALILACLFEAGMLATDQLRLWHAAREASRVAIVDAEPDEALIAAQRAGLHGVEMLVRPVPTYRVQGRPLTVSLTYRPTGHLPLVNVLFSGIVLKAQATMRIEQP